MGDERASDRRSWAKVELKGAWLETHLVPGRAHLRKMLGKLDLMFFMLVMTEGDGRD